MSLNKVTVVALVAAASIGGALACGPFFPWQLLDDRAATVNEPIGLGFDFQAAQLAPPAKDSLKAVEEDRPYGPPPDPEVVRAEQSEAKSGAWDPLLSDRTVSPEKLASKLDAARAGSDGKEALIAGEGLPVAVLEYIAGAVEFQAGHLDKAIGYFKAIDRLPPRLRQVRAVAAAYMRGRVQQRNGKADAARAAFQAARERAQAGAPDPMGLGVASYGEEARIDLIEAGLETDDSMPIKSTDDDKIAGRLIADAVHLYAEQAARGSKSGTLSLHEVAEALCGDADTLTLAIDDPAVRRLVVAYVVQRYGQDDWDPGVRNSSDKVVTTVIDTLLKLPEPEGDDLDRLAMLAYQAARYDAAERLTAKTDRPLGLWVRAKLDLRRGDRAAAIRDWTAAVVATEKGGADATLDKSATVRMRGELGVMKLSDGAYADSLKVLLPVSLTYWGDFSYIAERVLTVDELKSFVDSLPATDPKDTKDAGDDDNEMTLVSKPIESLRGLLGRRLIREGRLADAQPYFSTETPPKESDRKHSFADMVKSYREAIEAAKPAGIWHGITQAEAQFKVATMTREQGMELAGTEGPPDYAALDGQFGFGLGQRNPLGEEVAPHDDNSAKSSQRRAAARALLGPDEMKRFEASAPRPDSRFHYRRVASEQAAAAAELLPHGSQAYAATLCWASQWAMEGGDQKRGTAIWRQYVKTGAHQSWAKTFGQDCPDPDFDAARDYWPKRVAGWPVRMVRAVWRHLG